MRKIVSKPWGSYQVLDEGSNFLVKKIIVKPDGVLSLQSHSERSEQWIIVSGKANVQLDGENISLKTYDHITIPTKSKHRLMNYQDSDLVLIEIWYGDSLSEEDIVRYKDIYNRI